MSDTNDTAAPVPGSDIAPINLVDEMRSSYLDYAMSVIVSRALPDVRDGLKPVHRRILFASQENGFTSGKPFRKSARIVCGRYDRAGQFGGRALSDKAQLRGVQNRQIQALTGTAPVMPMRPGQPERQEHRHLRRAAPVDGAIGRAGPRHRR